MEAKYVDGFTPAHLKAVISALHEFLGTHAQHLNQREAEARDRAMAEVLRWTISADASGMPRLPEKHHNEILNAVIWAFTNAKPPVPHDGIAEKLSQISESFKRP